MANATSPAPIHSIAAFANAAARYPAQPALVTSTGTYTYHALASRVGGIAALLQQQSLGSPALVGIYTADDGPTYAALLAAHAVGAAYVPVNHKFPVARQAAVVAEAGLHVLLASTPVPTALQVACPGLRILDISAVAPAPLPQLPPYNPDRLAYLLFTSGSTGRPKGVPLTHGNLGHFLATMLDPAGPYDFRPSDRFLQMFELTFDLSVFSFFVPMCIGAACCTVPHEGIGAFAVLETLDEQGVTVALMVPSALAYLRPYLAEIELPHLRWSLFCGEALPSSLAGAWQQRIPHAAVENVYGPTEATIFCTRYRWHAGSPAESYRGVVPIGKPLPGVHTRLLSEDGNTDATDGELCLGGAQVTPGYWHNPEKNAEAFVPIQPPLSPAHMRYYRTGDICRRDANGNLLYLGRSDSQVKVDGYRIELGEIEHHARQLSGAQQLAVIAVPEGASTTLHLWLENWLGNVDELRQQLATVLPAYMQPRGIHNLPQLPLNSNGKIDRPALRQLVLKNP